MKIEYTVHFTEENGTAGQLNQRAQAEWEAEELIRQHRYEEARELLDMLAVPDEIGTMVCWPQHKLFHHAIHNAPPIPLFNLCTTDCTSFLL